MPFFHSARPVSRLLFLLATSALSAGHSIAADYGWEQIENNVGASTGYATAISGDGRFVIGNVSYTDSSGPMNISANRGFVWRAADDTYVLDQYFGRDHSSLTAINTDGSVMVGNVYGSLPTAAFLISTTDSVIMMLGTLGGTSSRATGVSGDGRIVSGWGDLADGSYRAFRWAYVSAASPGVMEVLPTLDGRNAFSNGISRDGRVIVGALQTPSFNEEAAYWVENAVPVTLGYLAGGTSSTAKAANADGSVIVGNAVTFGGMNAFRWTATGGMVGLGTLGGRNSEANAVSDNGTVVVGRSGRADASSSAFRWTESTGMLSVDDWLRGSGVTLASDITSDARGVSADGTIIVGELRNGKAFVARGASADPGGPSAGIIAVQDYMQSFNGLPRHIFVPQQVADLAMNGANSSPMFHRLSAGQRALWATGDLGALRNDFGTGPTGTGEIGFAYAPTDELTMRLALGTSYSKADLDLGGFSRVQGSYVLPEVSMAVAPAVYATLTGFASMGDLSMRRAYLNGSGTDASEGQTDARTLGFRARLDWLDALTLQDVSLTPYASFTHLTTKTDGYSEAGGSFPARFDEAKGSSNTIRLGLDGRLDLTETISLVSRAEVAHRFEGQAPNTTGEIIGFSSFDLPGAPIDQNWFRGGIGIQTKSGPLEGQLMLNASSQEKGTYWLSASTRVLF